MTENKANLPRKRKSEKIVDKPANGFKFSQISEFTGEVKREFGKIAWPNKKNTAASAMVVIVFVSIMAMYLGAVDLIVGKLVSLILN
ncbi:MAG: preprotein translocase subunit SecE [Thermodesulfobacteriota bacterium]